MKCSGFPPLFLVFLSACWSCSATVADAAEQKPNVLLICVDDLRPELNCFGADYIQSPNIDALAARGRAFHRHYVQAPTCGASRYALLTGLYGPGSNNAIFGRAKLQAEDSAPVPPSMPAWFRKHGYTTVSVGKVSHYPGGRGGPDWNDEAIPEMPFSWDRHLMPVGPWQHPRGAMHGLANGEIRGDAGKMDVFQSTPGEDTIYPDGLTAETALEELRTLAADSTDKPFFLAVGYIRPHLPFGSPTKYFEPYEKAALPPIPHPEKPQGETTWHKSGEFMKYNRWDRDPNTDPEFATEVRKHYAACVTYADTQVGKLLSQLEASGVSDNTVVILWGDHGWHLGEHAVWGKHTLFEESLRSPLIVSYPGISEPGKSTNSMVETIDIFPTLCELAHLPMPEFAQGVSLVPILNDPAAPGHPAISYQTKTQTIRTDTHRLILHSNRPKELYDHTTPEGETRNLIEEQPELAGQLVKLLRERLPKQ